MYNTCTCVMSYRHAEKERCAPLSHLFDSLHVYLYPAEVTTANSHFHFTKFSVTMHQIYPGRNAQYPFSIHVECTCMYNVHALDHYWSQYLLGSGMVYITWNLQLLLLLIIIFSTIKYHFCYCFVKWSYSIY